MMDTIFLIGFMGSGKSTVAQELSKKLQANLVEMDERIVQEQKMTINDIFEKYGESHFRDVESQLVCDIVKEGNAVVSCGGGVVVRPENVERMKEKGMIIYLTATPETIFERVRYSTNRPILNGNMNVEYIKELMAKRKDLYEAACSFQVATDNQSVEAICQEILDKIKVWRS